MWKYMKLSDLDGLMWHGTVTLDAPILRGGGASSGYP